MISANAASFSIVVGLDFEDAGGYAFGQAVRIARAIPGSDIQLVHVFEKELDDAHRTQLVGQLRNYANDETKALGGIVGANIGIHLRVGDPVREIVQLAREVEANMIVIGARNVPLLKSWVLGSVAHRLLLSATCPVLVAGPRPPPVHHEPEIEPPCVDCIQTRAQSHRTKWWCERHTKRAVHAHVFSYHRELPLATHDSEVIPTGIDF